jgi:hypothetical protein
MDFGILNLRNAAKVLFFKGTNSIGIKAPTSIESSFEYTLPQSLPGSTQALTVDTSGNLAYASLGGSYTPMAITTITASKNIGVADPNTHQYCTNTSAITITIPSGDSFPTSTEIMVSQEGIGIVNITAGGGVTLVGLGITGNTCQLVAQYAIATLKKVDSNSWRIYGAVK